MNRKTAALLSISFIVIATIAIGYYFFQISTPTRTAQCDSLQTYFTEFKNPRVVANQTYYIFRLNGDFSSLINGEGNLRNQGFNQTSSFILSSPVLRTQDGIPPSHPSLYFWSLDNGYTWKYVTCP